MHYPKSKHVLSKKKKNARTVVSIIQKRRGEPYTNETIKVSQEPETPVQNILK